MEFVTLRCPTCGGKLEIRKDLTIFACGFCGSEHIVIRQGGTIALNPVEENINQIRKGTDSTASELAIKRLTVEIEQIRGDCSKFVDDEADRWYGGLKEFIGERGVNAFLKALGKMGTFRIGKFPQEWAGNNHKRLRYVMTNLPVEHLQEAKMAAFGLLHGRVSDIKIIGDFVDKVISMRVEITNKKQQLIEHKKRAELSLK